MADWMGCHERLWLNVSRELRIDAIRKEVHDGVCTVTYQVNANGNQTELWYECSDKYADRISDHSCDCAVVGMFVTAMKADYDKLTSAVPMSKKLYYQLNYHMIPQLVIAGHNKIPEMRIQAPLIDEAFVGDKVATGMSRGVDSFATLCEYGPDFELEDYRVNALTYYKAGAHGRTSQKTDEKFEGELAKSREFCARYGYELIEVTSNLDDVLHVIMPGERFYRTHTVRNASMTLFLQQIIRRYYYSSAYNLDDFKFILTTGMAHYEKWFLPLLNTESISFYSANRNWSRLDKVKMICNFEQSYDYLQVCLTEDDNCGTCKKCKRTLMELDALGEDVLDRYANVFDLETYKRDYREAWWRDVVDYKESDAPDAWYFDESFAYAAEHRPELVGDLIREKDPEIDKVVLTRRAVAREYPSKYAKPYCRHARKEKFRYLGECGTWVAIEEPDGTRTFVPGVKVRKVPFKRFLRGLHGDASKPKEK